MKATQLNKWSLILLAMAFNAMAVGVAPEVIAIYPRIDVIPENTLKFQIRFNTPMREGNFLKHIELKSSDGQIMSDVFFDNVYELWSHDHRQITLLVDPGRVKTGLQENLKQGRAFVAGRKYTLSVLTSWRSLQGEHLHQRYTKNFTAVEEDLDSPDVNLISSNKLAAGTTDPLSISFPEPLDEQQLQDYVRVTRGTVPDNISLVVGKFVIEGFGKSLKFQPQMAWQRNTPYFLRIDTRLEDLASNNLQAKFDRPISAKKSTLYNLPFHYEPLQIN